MNGENASDRYYHVTKKDFVESILESGIKAPWPLKKIMLFDSVERAVNWGSMCFSDEAAVIIVDVSDPKSFGTPAPIIDKAGEHAHGAFRVTEDIPADRVSLHEAPSLGRRA